MVSDADVLQLTGWLAGWPLVGWSAGAADVALNAARGRSQAHGRRRGRAREAGLVGLLG